MFLNIPKPVETRHASTKENTDQISLLGVRTNSITNYKSS